MHIKAQAAALALAIGTHLGTLAQPSLRAMLKDDVGEHWIYDDFALARERAKASGQPLLVLFRCVP